MGEEKKDEKPKSNMDRAEEELMRRAAEKGLHVDFEHKRFEEPHTLDPEAIRKFAPDFRLKEETTVGAITIATLYKKAEIDEWVAGLRIDSAYGISNRKMKPNAVAVGQAFCSVHDNFCRQKGRIVALAWALKSIK